MALWRGENSSPTVELRRKSVTHCGAVKGWNCWALSCTNLPPLMRWWGWGSRIGMVSKQERQETVIQGFVSPLGEEMFKLDIYCKTQEALKLMFDTGHFCFFLTFSLSLPHTLRKNSFGVFVLVCEQLHPLLYIRSHYCSLSRPGLIVPHLTASQPCTKLAACCGGKEHWRIRSKIENPRKKYKIQKMSSV